MAGCVRVAGGMDGEVAIRKRLEVSPTRIDRQIHAKDRIAAQLEAVRQFPLDLRGRASPVKP